MAKVVTRERKAKSAKLEFVFVSAFRDNSSYGLNNSWVRCASGNVLYVLNHARQIHETSLSL